MFLSRYCIKFWKLNLGQQQNIIGVSNNIDKEEEDAKDNNDDGDDDDDITIPPIRYHDIARAGAFHLRTLTQNIVTSWEQQAAYLNTHPVPGLLSTFPHGDLSRGLDLETILWTALHIDWRLLCTSIRSSIKRVPRTGFDKVIVFGNEGVLLQL